jgi:glucose-6-phosphate 1-epimerase
MAHQTLAELQQRFSLPGLVRFEAGPGGLARAVVDGPFGSAMVYMQGAHLAEYRPRGHKPLLFMSRNSAYEPGKPLRGGVPVIFPWFGPRGGQAGAPLHGLVRTRNWTMESVQEQEDQVQLILSLSDDPETLDSWPHAFRLRLIITIGRQLGLGLEVHNPSDQAISFEEALHTYLAVGDVRRITIGGLAGASYIDKVDNFARRQEGPDPIRITGETDRIYLDTSGPCRIDDQAGGRRIIVDKSGSSATVLWNPWTAKATAMPDFGDDEWPEMICLETANAADNAITLAAGQTHLMDVIISVPS